MNELQATHAVDQGVSVTRSSDDVEVRLDYLRHVVVRYIVEPPLVKRSLVPVLATILHFGPEERAVCDGVVNKLVEGEASWLSTALGAVAGAPPMTPAAAARYHALPGGGGGGGGAGGG